MPHFQNKSNSTKVHGQFQRFLLCCHSHSTIQIPRFIGTPKAGSANEQLSFYAFPHSTTTDCDQRHFEILIAMTGKSTGQLMTHFSSTVHIGYRDWPLSRGVEVAMDSAVAIYVKYFLRSRKIIEY